jgi:hypothetical protein
MRIPSVEAIALPSAPRFTPGASSISGAASRDNALDISVVEPLRSTIARSSRPVFWSASIIPVDIASTDTSTATTPAMPITITNEVLARCGRLRKFIEVTAPTCLKRFIQYSPVVALSNRECFDNIQTFGTPCGW